MRWTKLNSSGDIAALLEQYGGFHDSCIVGIRYQSGNFVDEKRRMGCGSSQDHVLYITFQRQREPVTLELCFTGVRRFHIEGWRENYFCDIFGCQLREIRAMGPGGEDRLILWADNEDFSLEGAGPEPLEALSSSYIIAEQCRWRFAGQGQ